MLTVVALVAAIGPGDQVTRPGRSVPTDTKISAADKGRTASKDDVPPADEILLFEVTLNHATLSSSMRAYGSPSDPLLPVGELSRLLEIPLDVDATKRIVNGTVGIARVPLTIFGLERYALANGEQISFARDDVRFEDDDVYLRSSILGRLLPIDIAPDGDELVLRLAAREMLPVQDRLAREIRRNELATERSLPDVADPVLNVETPYHWLTRPAADISGELAFDPEAGGFLSRSEFRFAMDAADSVLSGYAVTDNRIGLSNISLKLERSDTSAGLLGPVHATYYALGDVATPQLALGPRSQSGFGAIVSTEQSETATAFEKLTLRGDLPLGFEVELYVNDVLLGAQGRPGSGRYEFVDVPLVRGRNTIRIVTYGPRGERSQQSRVVTVGGGQVGTGRFSWEAGLLVNERGILPLERRTLPPAATSNNLRAISRLTYGVSPGITLTGGASSFVDTLDGKRRTLTVAGLRTSLGKAAVQLDTGYDVGNGEALAVGLAGRLSGINYVTRHTEYRGNFFDETGYVTFSNGVLRRSSEITLDAAVPLTGLGAVPLSLVARRSKTLRDGARIEGQIRATLPFNAALVTVGSEVRYNANREQATASEASWSANLAASRTYLGWTVRGGVDFNLHPKVDLQTLVLTADRSLNDRYTVRLAGTKSFGTYGGLFLSVSGSLRTAKGDFGVTAGYETRTKAMRFGLQFCIGVLFNPDRGRYSLMPPGPANGGNATILAWEDDNADGIRQPGENPVSGLAIKASGRTFLTNSAGSALITGLGTGSTNTFKIDSSMIDLESTTMPPALVRLSPHAGSMTSVPYAFIPSSLVTVTLKTWKGQQHIGVSAIRLSLKKRDGPELTATTEYDGVAAFEAVPAGEYQVTLDEKQATRLGMTLSRPLMILVVKGQAVQSIGSDVVFKALRP